MRVAARARVRLGGRGWVTLGRPWANLMLRCMYFFAIFGVSNLSAWLGVGVGLG